MSAASTPLAVPADALAAHADWLARGRTGDGRLVVRDATLHGSLAGADLRGCEFERVEARGLSLLGANLDGAKLSGVVFERADLRRASLADTRFADCDLRRTMFAGASIDHTGFLRCAFGDFGSQPIGKPEVHGAYAIVSPDLSRDGDATRIGHAGEVDARWFVSPSSGAARRFGFEAPDGRRFVVQVLNMHLQWSREATPRFQDQVGYQGFSTFLADGAPEPFRASLDVATAARIRDVVLSLSPTTNQDPAGESPSSRPNARNEE